MIRVYLPTTPAGLDRARLAGSFEPDEPAGLAAHAVTPAIREWYTEGDLEDLELTALTEAAQASLPLLAGEPESVWRRVVVAADVPEETVRPVEGAARSAVRIAGPVALPAVVSVHVDEAGVEQILLDAVGALSAAAAGDEDAQFLLDEAEACDLLWYDATELPMLVGELIAPRDAEEAG